jgi:hypothetical protein
VEEDEWSGPAPITRLAAARISSKVDGIQLVSVRTEWYNSTVLRMAQDSGFRASLDDKASQCNLGRSVPEEKGEKRLRQMDSADRFLTLFWFSLFLS